MSDVTNPDNRARLKRLPIGFDLLSDILQGRVVIEDLPQDATVVDVRHVELFHTVEFVVQSASYPALRQGEMVERLHSSLALRYLDPNVVSAAEG